MTARTNVMAVVRDAFATGGSLRTPLVEPLDDVVDTMDEESFHILYQRTAGPLRAYAARVLGNVTQADDIVQESYLRLLRRPTANQDLQRLRALLFRIATNLMIDHWRSRRHEVADSSPAGRDSGSLGPDLPLRVDMERGFQQLNPQQRQMMWLAYVEGADHAEIAEAMGLRKGSVKVLLSRVRHKLAKLLGDRGC
jgi:RNA polymerase sigma-70 factor, ECF subfamily